MVFIDKIFVIQNSFHLNVILIADKSVTPIHMKFCDFKVIG